MSQVLVNGLVNGGRAISLPLPGLAAWPAAGSLTPTMPGVAGQHRRPRWDQPLQFRREVRVEQSKQPNGTLGIVALTQSRTGLLAQEVVMVKQRARQVVTALRTLEDEVRLVSWRVNADGTVLRTGSGALPLGDVQQVAMVQARNYVVACRTGSGELYLSRWDVSNTGVIYRAGAPTKGGQGIQWLTLTALTPDLVVVLALTAAQSWQIMLWQLQGDSNMTLLGVQEMPAALVGSGTLALLPPHSDKLRLATFLAEEQERFALQLWQGQPGDALSLLATAHLTVPDVVAIITALVNDQQLSLVVQSATGQLRLLTWQVSIEGELTLLDADTVLAEDVGHCISQHYTDGFALVYRTLAGDLCVQQWQQQTSGNLTLHAAGRSPRAPQGEVICCNEALEGNAPLLTGIIDERGEVTLITWRPE